MKSNLTCAKSKKFYKDQKGITLIALVITIVVLLILAGVTINAVFSDSGIIKKAQESQNKMNEARNSDLEAINSLSNEIDNISNHSNILFKGKTNEELNNFIKILHNEIYCVKTDDYDIKKICSKKKLNSINKVFEIQDNLLNNVKNNIKNGTIFFISENSKNLKELSTTINYIQSRGYKIVTINELLK